MALSQQNLTLMLVLAVAIAGVYYLYSSGTLNNNNNNNNNNITTPGGPNNSAEENPTRTFRQAAGIR